MMHYIYLFCWWFVVIRILMKMSGLQIDIETSNKFIIALTIIISYGIAAYSAVQFISNVLIWGIQ